jgi:hypothetical protein
MQTKISSHLIYAKVKVGNKYRLTKLIKNQLFVIHHNIKHHLIGNIYHDIYTNILYNKIIELSYCHVKPMYLTKFTFKHETKRKTHKQSKYEYYNN